MLSARTHRHSKQGFIYKLSSSFIAKWRLKFAVYSADPQRPVLMIYNDRDTTKPAKLEIPLRDATIVIPEDGQEKKVMFGGQRGKTAPFTLVTRSKTVRKHSHSTHSISWEFF